MTLPATQLDPKAIDAALHAVRDRLASWSFAPEVDLGERTIRLFSVQGLGKSGTTWIGKVLNLHPEIVCRWELGLERVFRAADSVLGNKPESPEDDAWRAPVQAAARWHARRMASDCLILLLASLGEDKRATVRLVGDKTPGFPRADLPGVPVVVAMRDGRDRLVSLAHHLHLTGTRTVYEAAALTPRLDAAFARFPRGQEGARQGFVRHLLSDEVFVSSGARHFAKAVQAVAGLRSAGVPVHVTRYEDMLADVEGARARLYDFLGVDAAAAAPIDHDGHTAAGVISPSEQSFYRRGISGEWREHDTGTLGRVFARVAGDELEKMGYDRE